MIGTSTSGGGRRGGGRRGDASTQGSTVTNTLGSSKTGTTTASSKLPRWNMTVSSVESPNSTSPRGLLEVKSDSRSDREEAGVQMSALKPKKRKTPRSLLPKMLALPIPTKSSAELEGAGSDGERSFSSSNEGENVFRPSITAPPELSTINEGHGGGRGGGKRERVFTEESLEYGEEDSVKL